VRSSGEGDRGIDVQDAAGDAGGVHGGE
jgi:hypothetical protein